MALSAWFGAPADAVGTPPIPLDGFKSGTQAPFSFKYGGKDSATLLSGWNPSAETTAADGGDLDHFTYVDPATKLKVVAEVRTFKDFDAVDWVLRFTNEGQADTPIIEDVEPLAWTATFPIPPKIHYAQGSNASRDDFQPNINDLGGAMELHSTGGRSSNNQMPFFNLQAGDQGLIGAIGWTGNWQAHFAPDQQKKTVTMTAGMQRTHFLLHPGETVRSPRIVLLNWHGDFFDGQNLWRRLVLAFYSPRDEKGQTITVPLSFSSWGTEQIATKLAVIKQLDDDHIPFDTYWVDAGWYGTLNVPPGLHTDSGSAWYSQRGSWTPSPALYPDGLKPLGDALKASGHGFILWLEAETANKGSTIRTQHPDWFMHEQGDGSAILDLAKPEARQGITDIVSKVITDSGMTWYRQDYNVEPEGSWASIDTPDRVGIEEINYITGLYQFWDDLRAQHPGLQIDNCASGGRRLDIETMSRSVSLWRSDYSCNPTDPSGNQMHTQALNEWVPLNSGVFGGVAPGTKAEGASLIYALRSGYSAGWIFGDEHPVDVMRAAAQEFHEVRPFFQGDFYPLNSYSGDLGAWTIQQWQRPDLKTGVVFVLRRQDSPYLTARIALRGIDPKASYDVEIRTGLEKGIVRHLTGADLGHLDLSMADKPGSELVFYRQTSAVIP